MNVRKEASGRRVAETSVEVSGTPEEVWKAIATSNGISSWFMPTTVEEHNGKGVSVSVNVMPGMDFKSPIVEWNAPHSFTTTAEGFSEGAPPFATQWIVEARDGGKSVVRIVQSLFATTDDWDEHLNAGVDSMGGFFKTLQIYMEHFRNQHSAVHQFRAPAVGTDAESWDALTSAFGLKGMNVGQSFNAQAGVPELRGVVEYFTSEPYDALLRIEKPARGVAAVGIAGYPGGPSSVGFNLYLYGDDADASMARLVPVWEAWFQETFPAPAE